MFHVLINYSNWLASSLADSPETHEHISEWLHQSLQQCFWVPYLRTIAAIVASATQGSHGWVMTTVLSFKHSNRYKINQSLATTTPVLWPFVQDYPGEPVPDKTSLDLLKQEIVCGSGNSWAIYKSAPHPKQITMTAPHQSDFYRLDALPAAQPIVSTHWRM